MRPSPRQFTLALAALLALPVRAEPLVAERIEWTKTPIAVALRVDAETQIQFPAPVKVGMPGSLKAELRTQSIGDTVYLKPSTAFDATRLVIQSRDRGQIYLLDVSSSDTAMSPKALRIVDGDAEGAASEPTASTNVPVTSAHDPVTLTRYAARQLYAPRRLVEPALGVVREPVSEVAVDLLRGGTVTAHPLIAWRSGRLHVTAVKLVNTAPTARDLDARELRGTWLTATFQHNRLLPVGDEADTTVVYLVSERPFALAL